LFFSIPDPRPSLLSDLERVPAVVKAKPELANVEPFKTVLSGNREAMAKFTMPDLMMNRHEKRLEEDFCVSRSDE